MFEFTVKGGDENKDKKPDLTVRFKVGDIMLVDETHNIDRFLMGAVKGIIMGASSAIVKLVRG